MSTKPDDDVSDLLSDLAEAQQKQEAELAALTRRDDPRPGTPRQRQEEDAEKIAEQELLAQPASAASSAEVEAVLVDEAHADEHDAQAAARLEGQGTVPPQEEEPYVAVDASSASEGDDPLAALHEAAGGEDGGEALEQSHEDEMDAPVDLGQPAGDPRARPTPQPGSRGAAAGRSRGGRPQMRRPPATNLKVVFAPVMITFGALMILLAMWGLLLLLGVGVPLSDRSGAGSMGLLMQLCWPIGGFLIAYAIMSLRSAGKARRDLERRQARE